MGSGPIEMAPGDSQEVVYGIINVADGDPLDSYLALKQVDVKIQNFVDNGFKTIDPPLNPVTKVTALDDAVIITWDNNSESYIQDDYMTAHAAADTVSQYIFEGYNVYQMDSPQGDGEIKRIATFDIINGITEIYDDVFDEDYGLYVNVITQHGSDNGIQHSVQISNDFFSGNQPLLINREYYFAVTVYAHNQYGIPKTLESEKEIIRVRPANLHTWVASSDTVEYNYQFLATHAYGNGAGSVHISIIDPTQITGDDYKVIFNDYYVNVNDTLDIVNWNLVNSSNNEILLSNQLIQDGVNNLTGDTLGLYASPIVDGLQIAVKGVNPDIDYIAILSNADGPVYPYRDGLAWWRYPDWSPGVQGAYENSQVSGAIWFLNTHPGYGPGGPETFHNSVVSLSGGLNSPKQGMAALVPHDFECKFTGQGKAYDYFGGTGIINVPFEWWNIGTGTPSDDYKLISYILDDDGDGKWGLTQNDHETSGGENDPYTDRIYVMAPTNDTPGTVGHDDFFENVLADRSNVAQWTSGPGENDPGGPMDTWNVFSRLIFMNWNGGDVNDPTWPANVNAMEPETGTVWRIVTTKPNSSEDVYTFSTASYAGSETKYKPNSINVWPNPYFGYNPEETGGSDRQIHFTNLPTDGKCIIRIFDLSGRTVRTIEHTEGTPFEIWDICDYNSKALASGMYIVHIETDKGNKTLKIAILQPQL